MQYLILYIVIIIISLVIAIKLKIKTEQAIPITVIGLDILVYLSGILANLKIGIYLIIILLCVSSIYIIYYLIKKKESRKNFIKNILHLEYLFMDFYI